MPKIETKYLDQRIADPLPEEANFDILTPIKKQKPLPFERLKNKVEKGLSYIPDNEVTILMNDHNRATKTDLILKASWKYFKRSLNKVIIATGSHTPPKEAELKKICGRDIYQKIKPLIINHKSQQDLHIEVGTTPRKTHVKLMERFLNSKFIVYINSVEPHYFAGFTGGRKSVLPGVSQYSTIEHNHSFALSPMAKTLSLDGNPVHEDMMDSLKFVDIPHTSFQIIQSPEGEIINLFTGDIKESFYKAARKAKEVFCTPIEKKYDIVISSVGYPLNRNLYQAQKGIENGKLALKEGGVLILVSPCVEGIGPEKFWKLLTEEETPQDVIEKIKAGYKLGYHKAAKIADFVMKNHLFIVSEIPKEVLKKGFIEGYTGDRGLDNAIEDALNIMGKDSDILYIPKGGIMIPYIKE